MSVPVIGGQDSYAWLYCEPDAKDDSKTEWRLFRQKDQQQLELAELNNSLDVVPVEGGRFEVRRPERQLVDRYSAVPPRETREIRRCLWQRQVASNTWEPFEEKIGERLEETYKTLLGRIEGRGLPTSGEEISETVNLTNDRTAKLKLRAGEKEQSNKWVLTAEDYSSSMMKSLVTRVTLKRGYSIPPLFDGEAEEEALSDNVDKLFIVVHGIGENMWKKEGTGIAVKASALRRNLQRQQLLAAGFKQVDSDKRWQSPKQQTGEEAPGLARIRLNLDLVFSEGVVYKAGSEADKAWDGDRSTFFDLKDDGYTAIKLEQPRVISQIRYLPRSGYGYAARMVGGRFEGSNNRTDWELLHEIIARPTENRGNSQYSVAEVMKQEAYTYIRYRGKTDSACNVADIILFEKAPEENTDIGVPKHEVLTVSWEQSVHSAELDDRLSSITLPSQATVRQIANQVVLDVIYFSQAGYRKKILKTAAEVLETLVASFHRHHPGFNGRILLVAHSLGGVILFELLRRGAEYDIDLSFTPSVLFTLGSPTGMFMHSADDVPSFDFTLPGGVRFFNIFHPLDPIAYRIEPLLAPEFAKLPPEQVPAEGYMGGQRMHHRISGFVSWARGQSKVVDELKAQTKIALNAHERVDWALQDPMNVIGEAGELLRALGSHSEYLNSLDVAAFIKTRTDMLDVELEEKGELQTLASFVGDRRTSNEDEKSAKQPCSQQGASLQDRRGSAPCVPEREGNVQSERRPSVP